MTRPAVRQSAQRKIAGVQRQMDSLSRRPAPITAASGLPWARRSKGFDAANQSIGNTSFVDITFNHDYNMGAGESGNGSFTTSGNGLQLIKAGYYSITGEVLWFDAFSTTWFLGISQNPAAAWVHGSFFAASTSTTMSAVISFAHRFDANDIVLLTTWQSSGSAKNVDSAYIEAIYLGSSTGTDYQSMNPNQ